MFKRNIEENLPYFWFALLVLALFYGIYFTKMLVQKKHGIQTSQIGKRKEKELHAVEMLMAAATFYQRGENHVDDLTTAGNMLTPLLGNEATVIFAIALLLAGLSSSITAGMAGGTIFSGIFNKPYDIATKETRQGVLITMIPAALIILLIRSPFQGLIYSQMLLAVQLPITIFTQIYLTSSKKVMGRYANSTGLKMVLWAIAIVVTALNIGLFVTGF